MSAKPEIISSLIHKKKQIFQRAEIIFCVRTFFRNKCFLEVETPVRIKYPAPEIHIDPIQSENLFLRTSPELQMKCMLSAGYEKIFQICPCFRKGEKGHLHKEEFTMLEWYEKNASYLSLIAFTRELILYILDNVFKTRKIKVNQTEVNFNSEWQIISVEEMFAKFANTSTEKALIDNMFEQIMVEKIEPNLPKTFPCILIDYPAECAAFSKFSENNKNIAERWELYIAGIEIANTYSELTDPVEQKKRFAKFAKKRNEMNKVNTGFDPDFLSAIDYGLPVSAGCALGLDRLVMLLCNADNISSVSF